MMEVEKTSKWPIKTNIDPRLQEDESTIGLVEELIDIQVDPNEPSRIIEINKGLNKELAQWLTGSYTITKMCLHGCMQT